MAEPEAMSEISGPNRAARGSARIQRLKDAIPWYAKIAAKIVLSRLPVSYDLWRRSSLFRHGAMDRPETALLTVRSVMAAARLGPRLDGKAVLELGPGDSLATALIAKALGARETTLVDAGPFASREMAVYRALAAYLEGEGLRPPPLGEDASAMLAASDARYLTEGVASLESLAPGGIDFAFSNAVLEHIRAHEFLPMMRALRRAMAPSGVVFHDIDLQDHLAYGLNNLRFSDKVWESPFMARSGFYTNRIGYGEMMGVFEQAGFSVELLEVRRFAGLPTPRAAMAPRFRTRSDEDLRVSGFRVLLRPALNPALNPTGP
jgi:SAM-dependent methyltransferase